MPNIPTRTQVGPRFSEGASRLWDSMRRKKLNQRGMTSLLGVADGVVNRWLWGDQTPNARMRGVVRQKLGIAFDLWDQPPARAFSPPRAA